MRKLLIFFTVLSLILCCCTVPVFADRVDQKYIDLLTADSYEINIGGNITESPVLNFKTNGGTVVVKWQSPYYKSNGTYYLYLESSVAPDTIRAASNSTSSSSGVVASLVGSNNNLYQYKWTGECNGNFVIRFSFSSAANVVVRSCYMTSQREYLADFVNVNSYGIWFSGNLPHRDFITTGQYHPSEVSQVFSASYDEYEYYMTQLEFPVSTLDFNVLEDFSLFFRTTKLFTVDCRIYNGTISNGISIPVSYSIYNSAHLFPPTDGSATDTGNTTWVYYSASIDLSEIQLDAPNSIITFMVVIDPMYYGGGSNQYKAALDIFSAAYSPLIEEEIPWYKTFWNWLLAPLNNIIELLRGDQADPDNVVEDNAAEMATQASVMDELNEQLQMVERPTVDSEELVQENIVIEPVAMNVMTSIINEDILVPVLIVICTLALLGYILFGSKGA